MQSFRQSALKWYKTVKKWSNFKLLSDSGVWCIASNSGKKPWLMLAALIFHGTKILSSPAFFSWLDPIFCHEKISVLLEFFPWTIKGQQSTYQQSTISFWPSTHSKAVLYWIEMTAENFHTIFKLYCTSFELIFLLLLLECPWMMSCSLGVENRV